MLIRFIVNNLYSFGQEKEFNMLAAPKYSKLKHHKYELSKGGRLLKLAAIYGANGAGKSNLVKALHILERIIKQRKIGVDMQWERYKYSEADAPIYLGIELHRKGKNYLYYIEFLGQEIIHEELYQTFFDKQEPKCIFERKKEESGQTVISLPAFFQSSKEGQILQTIIVNNLLKKSVPLLTTLSDLRHEALEQVREVVDWFEEQLVIIYPNSKPVSFIHRIDSDPNFLKFANEMVKSFHTGIKQLYVRKSLLHDFFGEDNLRFVYENHLSKLEAGQIVVLEINEKEQVEIVMEEGKAIVKQLLFQHYGPAGKEATFSMGEESDGTIRLIDYISAFSGMVNEAQVYIIDELERSIHPVIMKALIRKFAEDSSTKGQLVFTTHESNLLDHTIFRRDEIWFAEKDKKACTDLYPLSEYKEHHSKDIQKGYLHGRYSAIPFLTNLKDLNWQAYEAEKTNNL